MYAMIHRSIERKAAFLSPLSSFALVDGSMDDGYFFFGCRLAVLAILMTVNPGPCICGARVGALTPPPYMALD